MEEGRWKREDVRRKMDDGRWMKDDGRCHTDLTDNSDKLFINVGDFFAKIVWKLREYCVNLWRDWTIKQKIRFASLLVQLNRSIWEATS